MIVFKRVIFIFLAFCILAETLGQLVIITSFELNREYIAKYLCVKKAEENNCCKGSCQLDKELEEQAQKDKAASINPSIDISVYFISEKQDHQYFLPEHYYTLYFSDSKVEIKDTSISIFHPPKIVA